MVSKLQKITMGIILDKKSDLHGRILQEFRKGRRLTLMLSENTQRVCGGNSKSNRMRMMDLKRV